MALVGKIAIGHWFKRQEHVAVMVDNLRLQVARIEERIASLATTEARTHQQDAILAVLKSELAVVQKDLNGIGRKVGALAERK